MDDARTEIAPPTRSPGAPAAGVGQGTVAVVDGRIVVTDPDGGGRPATLTAGESVLLTIDGVEAVRATPVTTRLVIEADAGRREPAIAVEAQVAPDGMSAALTVRRMPGVRYGLEDHEPVAELVLTRRAAEDLEPRRPAPDDARVALGDAGVSFGLDLAAVRDALAAAAGEPVEVARGIPMTPPRDAVVEMPHRTEIAAGGLFSVRAGTVLARKTPARPGSDGTTVLGATVPAPAPADPPLGAGAGAVAEPQDGGVLVVRAAVDGRPVLTNGVLSVAATTEFPAGVDVSTGDVRMFGAVRVSGDVGEGRTVWASRDVTVTGDLHRAAVLAGGSLTLTGGGVHSRLRSGGSSAVLARALAVLDGADADFAAFAAATRRLVQAAAAASREIAPGALAFMLLEERFPDLAARIRAARALVRADPADGIDQGTVRAFDAAFGVTDGLRAHAIASPAFLDAIADAFGREVAGVRARLSTPTPAVVDHLQVCEIEVSGSLHVTGKGLISCTAHVSGDLLCEGEDASIRGGTYAVGGAVRVHEIGASGGARVVIELEGRTTVPDRLVAGVVHPGVRVVCNGADVAFDARRVNLSLGVDDEGRVTHASLAG